MLNVSSTLTEINTDDFSLTDVCKQTHQYTDGEHAYWVMNGMHMRYLNGLTQQQDGEDSLLPMTTTSIGINKHYAIELKLFRKVSIKGVVLGKEVMPGVK